jgi:hypothetical protein
MEGIRYNNELRWTTINLPWQFFLCSLHKLTRCKYNLHKFIFYIYAWWSKPNFWLVVSLMKNPQIYNVYYYYSCAFFLRLGCLHCLGWNWHGKFKAARWATVVSMMISRGNCQLQVAVRATTSKDIYPFWPMIARPFHYVSSTSCASTWLIQLSIHGKWLSLQRERRLYLVAFQ